MSSLLIQQIFFTTLALVFGLLHLVLYLYSRQKKSNLYFAIFAFLFAANIFFDYQSAITGHNIDTFLYLRIHRAVMPYNTVFALLFLYASFEFRIPIQFWIITLGLAITGFLAVLEPIENFNYIQFALFVFVAEDIRVITKALRLKRDGAWIICIGFSLLFLFSVYDFLLDLNIMQPINDINNGYIFGFLLLTIFMSIYLARDFARTNQKILEQERRASEMELQQRLLQVEDARKSKELDEARRLQLSMLPSCVNNIPGFDICFHMTPASEVGGDYYDYHYDNDGTFTVAIGDATGHGMKAGIMVSIIKSLFISETAQLDILAFFKKSAQTIKQMKLGNLYMAMLLLKINGPKLLTSSAGMPPIYLYRAATQGVEELENKAMPLGGPASVPYQVIEKDLAPGDTLLLMSDGFPELFNNKKEMLDYERVADIFKQAVEKSADDIVEHLIRTGKEWQKGQPQDDDITFVVIKIKN
jgi:serine phosphatase RsbU (regulator of sigma subunit)